ncbi:MAG: methyltransferase domain-containing protein [Roseiflexaceae bacterium]
MYPEALTALRCPICRFELRLESATSVDDEFVAGRLICQGCPQHYQIRDGIADLLGTPRPTNPAQLTNEIPLTAWAYERFWRPHALSLLSGTPLGYEQELALVQAWSQPLHEGLVLDVACSNGLYARTLAAQIDPQRGHVIGIDYALPMLQEARQRAREANLRISYVRAQAQALPVAQRSVTVLTIGGSLNEIGDLAGCLREIHRTLAPHGRFVAMTLTRHPRPFERMVQQLLASGGISFWETDELLGHFARHGLHTHRRQQHGIVLLTQAGIAE